MAGQLEQLEPTPTIQANEFAGYQHFQDPTILPFNVLTYPSINCLIPSRDKIVPRLGKTILGQRFSKSDVAIDFDNFATTEKSTGDIIEDTPLSIPSDPSMAFSSSVLVDSTHVLNFWGDTNGQGLTQVFEINVTTGKMTPVGSALVFQTNVLGLHFQGFNSCGQIDATHFINFWSAAITLSGFAQVFHVDPTTYAVTALGSTLNFDVNDNNQYHSCVKIDGSHFLNFWANQVVGEGHAQAFAINLSTWAVTTVGSPLAFDTGVIQYNSCGQIDTNHFINFYSNQSGGGFATVVTVNLSTFAVTILVSPVNYAGVNDGISNSCIFVDSTHFLNFWGDALSTQGTAQVFAISIGGASITALGTPFVFDTGDTRYNSCASYGDGTNFINFWINAGSLKARVFSITPSTGAFEALGSAPANFEEAPSTFNSAVAVGDAINFVNFWTNPTIGRVAIFKTDLAITSADMEFTCSGDNRVLFVSVLIRNVGAGDRVTAVTYNGVAMTLGAKVALDTDNERYMYFLVNPTAGIFGAENGVVVTTNSVNRSVVIAATSYVGAKQSAPTIMSTVGPSSSISTITISETTIDDNSWVVGLFSAIPSYAGGIAGAQTIMRGGGGNFQMGDTGEPVSPPGSVTIGGNFDAPTTAVAIAIAFSPAGGTAIPKNWPVIGHKERFTNDGGYVMEVRVVRTDDLTLKDQIEVLLDNPITGIPQWYPITEKSNPLEQGTADRYYMDSFFDTNLNPAFSRKNSRLVWVNGTKTIFSWSGGINPITDVGGGVGGLQPYVIGTPGKSWISQGFPNFFSTNFTETKAIVINGRKYNTSNTGRKLTLTNIVGTFGFGDFITGGTSGATATVLSVSPGSIFISPNAGTFIDGETITASPSGVTAIITAISLPEAGWDTDTLLLENSESIQVGDVATAWIAPPNSNIAVQDTIVLADTFPNIDFCRQNKNYMFYGSFTSRQLFMSNNFNRPAIETITLPAGFVTLDDFSVPVNTDFSGSTVVVFTVSIDGASPDTFDYEAVNSDGEIYRSPLGIPITTLPQLLTSPFGNVTIIFRYANSHAIGDTWRITCSPAIGDAQFLGDTATPPAWANFFYNLPRVPGQGYIFFLPSNFWTMESQEEDMYVSDQYGNWSYITTTVASDLASETITFTPLKQISASKAIFPYMVSHMENYIVFVTENKTLDFIGRQAFLELPQTDYLSQAVAFDFEACSFKYGSIKYISKMLHITSPQETTMLVYDNRTGNKFWQPPQTYTENGILSIVDNTLISHSNLRNQTFNLFTGDSGDDGAEYTVRARTALTAYFKLVARKRIPARWDSKLTSNSFIEGYITGNPQLVFTAFLSPNDDTGQSHTVKPVISDLLPDKASIAEDVLGGHPLGNDSAKDGTYFNEIYRNFKPILSYYFISLQIACVAKTHSYSILSLGVNMAFALSGNNTLIGDRSVK